jgi:IclR helix-turn-helix domain
VIDMSPSESEPSPEGYSSSEPAPERRFSHEPAPRRAEESGEGRFAQEPPEDEPLVSITLSRNQVDHVVRAALGEDAVPSISGAVAGTGFHRTQARQVLSSKYRALQENRRLSRSLLAGLLVLSCFPPEGSDMGIKDISEQLELNTSTVHRYVLTLVAAGLLERDPDTRRYRLLPE